MEITWYGQTCFRLGERGMATIVTDPCSPDTGLILPRPRVAQVDAIRRAG